MTIDKIGSIEPIQPGKKPGRIGQVNESPKTDTISISQEAQEKAERLRVQALASSAPDVRLDRVAEIKSKINDPSYIDDRIIDATANRLIDALFG
jgi:negative regulator of flagellin synthesis FlgM